MQKLIRRVDWRPSSLVGSHANDVQFVDATRPNLFACARGGYAIFAKCHRV